MPDADQPHVPGSTGLKPPSVQWAWEQIASKHRVVHPGPPDGTTGVVTMEERCEFCAARDFERHDDHCPIRLVAEALFGRSLERAGFRVQDHPTGDDRYRLTPEELRAVDEEEALAEWHTIVHDLARGDEPADPNTGACALCDRVGRAIEIAGAEDDPINAVAGHRYDCPWRRAVLWVGGWRKVTDE